jgi:hypothetical protein
LEVLLSKVQLSRARTLQLGSSSIPAADATANYASTAALAGVLCMFAHPPAGVSAAAVRCTLLLPSAT